MRYLYSLVGVLVLVASGAIGAFNSLAGPPPEDGRELVQFGISIEKYTVQSDRVSRYQTFADLLTPHGVSYSKAVKLARAIRPEFNVRNIETGQPYRVFVNPWLRQAQYLVYHISPVRYVVFDVQSPSKSHVGRRPVERKWTLVEGTINSSLYETLTTSDAHPKLALRLSEVFAWQIDFFRIRKGDSFRVLYEQRFVEDEQVAPGKIIAAAFHHQEERFYGFRFDDGGEAQYFNRQGKSLRRQLLKAPLRYTRISSGYSHSRFHPVLKRRQPHLGTDYAAPTGTPVHSVGDGTVVKAGYYGPNGNYVKIRHNETYASGYLHLTDFADSVATGVEVEQGETIGYVGSTGRSTGPHLDYRLWKHGKAVDPYELELPPTRPVNPQYRVAYRQLVEDRLDRLFPLRTFKKEASDNSLIATPLVRPNPGATARIEAAADAGPRG